MIPFSMTIKDMNGDRWVVSCEIDGEFDSLDKKRIAGSPMQVKDLKINNLSFVRMALPVIIERCESLANADDRFAQSTLNEIETEAKNALLREYDEFMDECNPRK